MEKNIFEGAKFGDKYELKDGRIAIFSRYVYSNGKPYMAALITTYEKIVHVKLDGSSCSTDKNLDIVSRYQEPIDEDKLDELAMDFYLSQTMLVGKQYRKHVMDIFKAAYRKIKDEK